VTVVLLTGAPERVAVFSSALQEAGCDCITALPAAERIGDVGAAVAGQVDAYVQLPVLIEAASGSVMRRVRDLLTQGLVARFENAESAVSRLRDGGLVVLVAGNTPGDVADDRRARYSLLQVLRHAIVADTAGRDIRAVVMAPETRPDDVVATVLGTPTAREQAIAEFLDRDTDMDYDDWRLELLSLVTNES
jgi:hypothetical protein